MRTKIHIATAISIIAIANLASAGSPFDWDLEFAYAELPEDVGIPGKSYAAALTRYHTELQYRSDLPFDETAFGDRVGLARASAFLGRSEEITQGSFGGQPRTRHESIDRNELELAFDFRQEGSPHIIMADLGIGRTEGLYFEKQDGTTIDSIKDDSDRKTIGLGYGYYLAPLWTATIEGRYDGSDFELRDALRNQEIGAGSVDDISLSVGTKRLWKVGKKQWAGLSFSPGIERNDLTIENQVGLPANERWVFEMEGVFYPSRNMSLVISHTFNGDNDDSTLIAQLTVYPTEALRLQLAALQSDTQAGDFETLALAAGYRF